MSRGEVCRQSRAIVGHLTKWPVFLMSRSCMMYASLAKEVQIQSLIRRCLTQGKTIYLPWCDPKRVLMRPHAIESWKELVRGLYGILQPKPLPRALARRGQLDVLLIPGLAFDARGNRLGRGKGYYDKFLRRWGKGAVKVGLALGQQLRPSVPANARDVKMDFVVHPEGIIACHENRKKS